MSIPINEERRAEIEERVKRRIKFYRSLGSYITTNLVLWAIWFFTGMGAPWPLAVMFFWGIGLVSEFSKVFIQEPIIKDLETRELERARRELGEDWDPERPKRKNVALGDDGELIYEDEAAALAAAKRKNEE